MHASVLHCSTPAASTAANDCVARRPPAHKIRLMRGWASREWRTTLVSVLGIVAYYLIMPGAGWLIAVGLQLPPELALGLILVGCAPSGTASNVMARLFLKKLVAKVLPALPWVSAVVIPLVVAIVVAGSAGTIVAADGIVFPAVVLHNGFGLGLGNGALHSAGRAADRRTASFQPESWTGGGLLWLHERAQSENVPRSPWPNSAPRAKVGNRSGIRFRGARQGPVRERRWF